MSLTVIRRYRSLIITSRRHWRKEELIRYSGQEIFTPEIGELKQGLWFRIAGVKVAFREDWEIAGNGSERTVFERRQL